MAASSNIVSKMFMLDGVMVAAPFGAAVCNGKRCRSSILHKSGDTFI